MGPRAAFAALGLALASLACAPAVRRQTFQYSDLIMIRAEAWEVDQACLRVDTRNDEGANIRGRVRCCWDESRRQLWVAWDDVDCIPHELCHVDRQPRDVCRRMHWSSSAAPR
ncbi:MAG: hypothetical protein HY554_08235 [Elusimicrobia bacterium]|nr:hypothetical protein [Elusimicrobiota bacterium]